MKWKVSQRRLPKWVVFVMLVMLGLCSLLPLRIAVAFYQAPLPQAILVLGGDFDRTVFAAKFWHAHQNMDVFVSDFASGLYNQRRILQPYGVPGERLRLDGRAKDTVTNFTTLVEDFQVRELRHIYLITSDYHMLRSRAIATIVLGSRGIVVTPIELVSPCFENLL